MKRSEARDIAFSLIFEASFSDAPDIDEIRALAEDCREFSGEGYIDRVSRGTLSKLGEIDEIINKYSTKWKADRLSRVVLSALRLAIYEICFEEDVPSAVAANEAVELIKKYDGEESSKYANGVLGTFLREREDENR